MDHDANDLATNDDGAADAVAVTSEPTDATVDELLIEEISIDGMCGVY
ncbi:mycofactocin precursor MftA [Ilumatobacter sp.]